jgi:hypothetical protein
VLTGSEGADEGGAAVVSTGAGSVVGATASTCSVVVGGDGSVVVTTGSLDADVGVVAAPDSSSSPEHALANNATVRQQPHSHRTRIGILLRSEHVDTAGGATANTATCRASAKCQRVWTYSPAHDAAAFADDSLTGS